MPRMNGTDLNNFKFNNLIMKRLSLITLILTLSIGIAKAGEGMWIPMLLQYNEK